MNVFSIWVGAGASLGLLQIAQSVPRWQAGRWVNAGLFALLGCLAGSRLVYVAIHALYYSSHLLEIPQIWLGGLSWSGALGGGALAVAGLARAWGLPAGKLADTLTPLINPLAVATWLGCWQVGAAYGPLAPSDAWWAIPCRDESGQVALRWPLQPAAAVLLLFMLWWLERRPSLRARPGLLASLSVLALSLNLLAASFFRADQSTLWHNLRPDTWTALAFSLIFAVTGLAAVYYARPKRT